MGSNDSVTLVSTKTSLLQMAAVCIVSFLVADAFVYANPSDLSKIAKRNGGTPNHKKLLRRQYYIESSGADVNVTITVPLNTAASSNQTLASTDIQIPYTSLVATAFSNGGGTGETISGGGFAERQSGMGTRNEIYGTARYGSGYGTYKIVEGDKMQYTPELTLNISGRDFPHGFPPLTWGNYSGGKHSDELVLSDYPGTTPSTDNYGDSYTVSMASLARKGNQTWLIIADGETINVLNAALQLPIPQGCGIGHAEPQSARRASRPVTPSTIIDGDSYTDLYSVSSFEGFLDFTEIYAWNIVQYYRGSSIALASMAYNNVYSHNSNNNTDYWASSPINTLGVDMDFLNCLNTTIAAVAPIVNPSLIVHQRLTPGQISGIVIGIFAAVALILAGIWFVLRRRRQKKDVAALAAGKIPSRRHSSTKKGVGLGETPGDYELGDHHLAPHPIVDDTTTGSSHEPHNL